MEIKKNRYGEDRSYERVDDRRIRVRGNSKYQRVSEDENGNITMFDFEGGPCFNLNRRVKFKYREYKIKRIQPLDNKHDELCEVVLHI
mgnify:FL=1